MAANYSQPDFRNPVPNSLVGIPTIIPIFHNALQIGPIALPHHIENLTDKDDPHGTTRGKPTGK